MVISILPGPTPGRRATDSAAKDVDFQKTLEKLSKSQRGAPTTLRQKSDQKSKPGNDRGIPFNPPDDLGSAGYTLASVIKQRRRDMSELVQIPGGGIVYPLPYSNKFCCSGVPGHPDFGIDLDNDTLFQTFANAPGSEGMPVAQLGAAQQARFCQAAINLASQLNKLS